MRCGVDVRMRIDFIARRKVKFYWRSIDTYTASYTHFLIWFRKKKIVDLDGWNANHSLSIKDSASLLKMMIVFHKNIHVHWTVNFISYIHENEYWIVFSQNKKYSQMRCGVDEYYSVFQLNGYVCLILTTVYFACFRETMSEFGEQIRNWNINKCIQKSARQTYFFQSHVHFIKTFFFGKIFWTFFLNFSFEIFFFRLKMVFTYRW